VVIPDEARLNATFSPSLWKQIAAPAQSSDGEKYPFFFKA
jgi:hypothetical protein